MKKKIGSKRVTKRKRERERKRDKSNEYDISSLGGFSCSCSHSITGLGCEHVHSKLQFSDLFNTDICIVS